MNTELKGEKCFSKGNVFLASYTFGKAINDSDSTQLTTTSGTGNLQDQRNFRSERSPSFQNVKHRFVLSYVCELPVGRGRALLTDVSPAVNRIVGGWQINGITFHQSGRTPRGFRRTCPPPSDHHSDSSIPPRSSSPPASPLATPRATWAWGRRKLQLALRFIW
jgi:hypothetical protein